jgi:NhaA family Na+:H+ antiporter
MATDDSRQQESLLPKEPVQRLTKPLAHFLHIEAASGVVLLACAVVALAVANSPVSEAFLGFWEIPLGVEIGEFQLRHPLKHWVNDGLMVVFFFVIGLEVKRELVLGELREVRRAAMPVAAALGGMLAPAGLYLVFQAGAAGQRGWGVPMATDIAFVVGCMALLGPRVPGALRVMLLSLAIVDDIGAILVIAVGYTETLHLSWLATGAIGIAIVIGMQFIGVRSMGAYTILGVVIWLGFHESGVHATIAGVVLGLLTPARPYLAQSVGGELLEKARSVFLSGTWESDALRAGRVREYQRVTHETISPLAYLIYLLHHWVAFLIMPLFALANAGVALRATDVVSPVAIAVMVGLVVGKPTGILLLCWLSLKLGIAELPASVSWRQITGGGFLAGIGFTMALFIAGLALEDDLLRSAKVGVLLGSLISAVVGMVILAGAPMPPSGSPARG